MAGPRLPHTSHWPCRCSLAPMWLQTQLLLSSVREDSSNLSSREGMGLHMVVLRAPGIVTSWEGQWVPSCPAGGTPRQQVRMAICRVTRAEQLHDSSCGPERPQSPSMLTWGPVPKAGWRAGGPVGQRLSLAVHVLEALKDWLFGAAQAGVGQRPPGGIGQWQGYRSGASLSLLCFPSVNPEDLGLRARVCPSPMRRN